MKWFFADPENDMEYYEEHHESRRDPLPENQKNTKQKSKLPKEATTPINGKNRQHILQESVDKSTKPSNTKASNTESPYKRIIHKSTRSTSQQDVSTI